MHAHLANLEKIGLLRRDPSKPRAIELLFDKAKKTIRPDQAGLPLLGHVAAGAPILAEENIEEYIEIPDVVGGEEGDYVLRVRGESMKEAGIFEADYVIVRPADDATDGEIVVALIGEEATVKRFFRESDHIRLQPENETMEPIRSAEVTVIGRVIGVVEKSDAASGPLSRLDQPLVAPLAPARVAHHQRQQPQGEAGEEVEEAQQRPAPARQHEQRPRAFGQLADRGRDLPRGEQLAGEGAGRRRVVELVLEHRRPDAVRADRGELHAGYAGRGAGRRGCRG